MESGPLSAPAATIGAVIAEVRFGGVVDAVAPRRISSWLSASPRSRRARSRSSGLRDASPMTLFCVARISSAARYRSRQRSQARSNRSGAWASVSSSQGPCTSRRRPGGRPTRGTRTPPPSRRASRRRGGSHPDLWEQRKRRLLAGYVEQVRERAAERLVDGAQPDRVDVAADEVLVGELEARRADLPRDHAVGPAEEVRVVRRPGRAVREHQRRLARAPGAAGPLGVVGGRRRHVAEPDDVELADVDAELHRGRAVQDGQAGLAERLLALLALGRRHLRRVLLGADPDPVAGDLAVEADEVVVDAEALLGRARDPDRVVERRGPRARVPAHGRRSELVPGDGAGLLGRVNDEEQARDLEDLAELADDDLALVGREPLPGVRERARARDELAQTAERAQVDVAAVVRDRLLAAARVRTLGANSSFSSSSIAHGRTRRSLERWVMPVLPVRTR